MNNDNDILNMFIKEFKYVNSLSSLEKIKIKYLGRNGIINKKMKLLKKLLNKKEIGKKLNYEKQQISLTVQKKEKMYNKNPVIAQEIDVTLPKVGLDRGYEHIVTQTINDIETFFFNLGFEVLNGHEIDTNYYNFEALNIPTFHPSKSERDTFYITSDLLLRTHTSNMQIHFMEKNHPPFKCLSYGKVYRRDSDISHTPMFHQVEGFIVDKQISIANLKSLLSQFLNFFFHKSTPIRMRSSFFPFTEPSAEIDIKCINCAGNGCSVCKNSGWIEVLGCGIIHPNVLKNCEINPNLYTGLAFGMGVERLSMIKNKVNDLRLFFENNLSFLEQFK